jgi:hypothetical protein
MFVHAVYFWLNPDLTDREQRTFVDGLHALAGIESVTAAYVGGPAGTDRAVVERSYTHSLVVLFADRAAHDVYQAHAVHERFRVDCGNFWAKVVIYDSVAEAVHGHAAGA